MVTVGQDSALQHQSIWPTCLAACTHQITAFHRPNSKQSPQSSSTQSRHAGATHPLLQAHCKACHCVRVTYGMPRPTVASRSTSEHDCTMAACTTPTALGHSHQGPAITQHLHVSHPQKQCDTAPQTTTQGSSRSQRSCSIPADPPQQLGTQVKYVCTRRHARSSKPHSPAGLAVYESHNLT